MTRKAPTGAKHSGCRTHVAHDYVRSGWLCITTATENVAWPESNYLETAATDDAPAVVRIPRDMQPVDRQADMVAFADHLAAVAMAHRSAELERLTIPTDPGNGTRPAYVGSPTHIGGPTVVVDVSPKRAKRSRANVRAVEPEHVDQPEPEPTANHSRGRRQCLVHGRAGLPTCDLCGDPWTEPMRESVEPETSSRRDEDGEPDPNGTALAHDFGNPCHCIVCEPVDPEPVQPCPYTTVGHEACIAGPIGHDGAHEYPTVQPCYHYLHTVGVPPIRCDAGLDGHDGAHHYERVAADEPEPEAAPVRDVRRGPADAAADMVAGPGWTLPRADAIAAGLAAAPESEPVAAVDAAPEPVSAADGRPTCERCGQVFRKHGTGAEWHRVNRPDCAGARPALAIAS